MEGAQTGVCCRSQERVAFFLTRMWEAQSSSVRCFALVGAIRTKRTCVDSWVLFIAVSDAMAVAVLNSWCHLCFLLFATLLFPVHL